ncbi:unnamed protein product [Urochloa decumbens]|uniref:F-box domain-containing protein n=1 Tax=Urochloa decumbens TaxID=240449 RepID=A0ABC9FK87_9POAL
MTTPPPPPAIPGELVEEALLRVPPDDPASLVRASLVCKDWCRLISAPGFRRRLSERHGAPPLLGFVGSVTDTDGRLGITRFLPTSSFRPRRAEADLFGWVAIHSCHGRVLLFRRPWCANPRENRLLVWDPVADERRELPRMSWRPEPVPESWNAAVLCSASAAAGCNYSDCHRGPFLVIFVGTLGSTTATSVYSSDANAWSERTSARVSFIQYHIEATAIAENALYFNTITGTRLVKCDLSTREVSWINLPTEASKRDIVLMAMEDGRLGFAMVKEDNLYIWSREVGLDGEKRWAQSRIIELNKLLPADALYVEPHLAGYANGAGVVFLWTCGGFFSVDLNSLRVEERGGSYRLGKSVVPVMSFCTPALGAASTGEGSGPGA